YLDRGDRDRSGIGLRRGWMHPGCLEFCLTEEERRTFDETGLLMVEDALAPEHVAQLTERVDRIYERKVGEGHDPRKALFFPNFIPEDDMFLARGDGPRVFPKVWGILGWNIYLSHCPLIVPPPSGEAKPEPVKTLGWHQDSGRVNVEIECHPRPR